MQKLYAYVDESGQDTKGRMFVVGVVVLEKEYGHILKELNRIEENSKTGQKVASSFISIPAGVL